MSDSHGQTKKFHQALELVGDVDCWLHAGDSNHGSDVEFLRKISNKSVYCVAGNNDLLVYYQSLPEELEIDVAGKKIVIVHGHRQHVKWGMHDIKQWIEHKKIDILVFGHTHEVYVEKWNNILIVNPGSVGFSFMSSASVAVIDTNCQGKDVEVKYL